MCFEPSLKQPSLDSHKIVSTNKRTTDIIMTTETTITTENQTAKAKPKRRAATAKTRSKRKKADHRPLKVMLTAGAFLATWMGTGWMAQQDAIAAAEAAPSQATTIAHVAPDGTVSERIIDLQPIPQVVVTSTSSQ